MGSGAGAVVDIAGRSHRQRLGQVIAFLRQQRGHDHRMVSRVCAMPIRDVEAMERGEHVPTFEQWSKLKRAVNRGLHEYGDLYRLACEERDAELAAEQSPPASRVGTNLGAKLQTALAAAPPPTPQPETEPVTEKPKPDTTKLRAALAALPDGWKSRDQIERRKAYALEQLRLRPGIRTSGADSLDTLLQRTFGVGLSDAVVRELRAQRSRGWRRSRSPSTPTATPRSTTRSARSS